MGCDDMVSFRKIFKPTFDEKLKLHLNLYHLCMKSYEEKWCTSCKHCYYKEGRHIGGVIDSQQECKLNESNIIKRCDKYEKDYEFENEIFDMIKEFINNKS